jgi:hypothetical protein
MDAVRGDWKREERAKAIEEIGSGTHSHHKPAEGGRGGVGWGGVRDDSQSPLLDLPISPLWIEML